MSVVFTVTGNYKANIKKQPNELIVATHAKGFYLAKPGTDYGIILKLLCFIKEAREVTKYMLVAYI